MPAAISIQAKRIAHRAHPGQRRRNALIPDLADLVPERAQRVRQKDFHSQSQDKEKQAVAEGFSRDRSLPLFKSDIVPPHNGTLGHLWEHGKIDHRVHDVGAPCDLPPKEIRLIGDHLEQVEAESQWEHDLVSKPGQDLEQNERTRVYEDRQIKSSSVPGLHASLVSGEHHLTKNIIDDRKACEQCRHAPRPHGIKNNAPEKQDHFPEPRGRNEIYDQKYREKPE